LSVATGLESLPLAQLDQLLSGLETAWAHKQFGGQILFFQPYIKQRQFLDLGLTHRERLLIAGNQNGKSITGAFEAACHLTGAYPPWWAGMVFRKPTRGWLCGETSTAVRDIAQRKLCGPPGVVSLFGSGMIPRDAIVDKSLGHGVTDGYDTIQVKHVSGGVSTATAKSYEQGRAKFQGESLDWIWWDEEPPADIYSEGLTRTAATGGISFMTFTPLNGPTAVVNRFLDEPSVDRAVITMTIDDALHFSAAHRARLIASWPPHEREARARGVPMLGSGRIFGSMEDSITEPAIEVVPPYWYKLWGIDIGIGHPFAAVLLLWDRDADVIHVHHTIRVAGQTPLQHAAAMKPYAAEVPVAYPKDAGDRDRGTGMSLVPLYKAQGLRMLDHHATHADGGYSTEAGIMEWDEREQTGRLKVASHLSEWFEERRLYHRKDGQIVKIKDDLMSATRVGLMAKRYARQVPLGGHVRSRPTNDGLATGIDFQLT
jgi:phage terminase large subunit-like protein